jgi:peptide deformylase
MRLSITSGRNNPILRQQSPKIAKVTKKILKLIRDMEEAMFAENGVGIAAPQVGVNLQMALMLIDGKKVIPIINPEIVDHGKETTIEQEGCLSLREEWGDVERWKEVTLKYMNPKGEAVTMRFTDFNARIAQHETDHLNGVLFVDHLK